MKSLMICVSVPLRGFRSLIADVSRYVRFHHCFRPLTGIPFLNRLPKDELKRYKQAARFRPLTGIPFLNRSIGSAEGISAEQSFRPLTGIPFLNLAAGGEG